MVSIVSARRRAFSGGGLCLVGATLALATPALATPGDFVPAPTSPESAGSYPHGGVVDDFNHDGDLDVAVLAGGDVQLMLGDGTGDFSAVPTTPGYSGQDLTAGDFNEDGDLDLALLDFTNRNVQILLGDGAGEFIDGGTTPGTGAAPFSITNGDFNGDDHTDLAVPNSNSNTVTVMLGSGLGGFTASDVPTGVYPYTAVAGRFNADNRDDLAVANYSDGTVSILLADPAGGFTSAGNVPAGYNPQYIDVGRFDANATDDLAVVSGNRGGVTVLLGDGAGSFSASSGSPESPGSQSNGLTVGRFDRDGDDDIAVANIYRNDAFIYDVSVLLGSASGDFTEPATSPEPVGPYPYDIASGDFNANGVEDLVTFNYNDSTLTVLLGGEQRPISIAKAGTGSGTVTSSPDGLTCGATCSAGFDLDNTVTLTATPATGSDFTGWSPNCTPVSGHPEQCTTTADGAKTVTATFTLQTRTLTVATAGAGSGEVTSTPAGISCGVDCTEVYDYAQMVTLTASPGLHSTFTGFSGDCTGTDPCTVSMTQARSVTATFAVEQHTLSVAKSGTGSGTVASSPAGIDCGGDCSEAYDYTTSVTLTATAANGSTFAGFTGDCTGTAICTVSLAQARSVTAEFADTLAPSVSITSGPAGTTADPRPSFDFTYEAGATLACSIDSGSPTWAACSSPTSHRSVNDLADGAHTFRVRATDAAGNAATATRDFTTDATPPDTALTGPEGTITVAQATFELSSTEVATFECRIDDAALAPCDAAMTYSSLSDGVHTVEARATDAVGNVDPTPAVVTFTVDTAVTPDTTITKGPKRSVTGRVLFEFASNVSGSTFACAIDKKAPQPCDSPQAYRHLKPGRRLFSVVATGPTGKADPSPATARFKVKPKRRG